jgi:hypothetical protein
VGTRKRRLQRAKLIRAVFEDCRILLVLRQPISLMISYYFEMLKAAQINRKSKFGDRGRYFDIETWLNQWVGHDRVLFSNKGILDYAHTVRIFVDLFGRESVGVFIFERLIEDPAKYIADICGFLGIKNHTVEQQAGHAKHNSRWTESQIETLKAISKSQSGV